MMCVKIQKYMPVFFNYINDSKINALFDCFNAPFSILSASDLR